jgi:hypothetical protein
MTKLLVALFCSFMALGATDDAAILGAYSFSCSGIAGSFKLTEDGVRKTQLNGKVYADTDLGNKGRFGYTGIYEIELETVPNNRTIQLFVLFDEDDRIQDVTGFYMRTAPRNGRQNDPALTDSCVLRFKRKNVAIGRRPSKVTNK